MIKSELKELLQKHDSEIFTDELVESVSEMIQLSIDTEVNERVKVIQDEKEVEVTELKESINEKSVSFEEASKEKMEKLVDSMTKWLDETKIEAFTKITKENKSFSSFLQRSQENRAVKLDISRKRKK